MVTEETSLLSLPNELIYKILCTFDNLSALGRMIRVCKKLNMFADDRLWKNVRSRHGLPDPSIINLTDYQIFKAFYGFHCVYCCRYIAYKYTFGGLHMCNNCLSKLVKDGKWDSCIKIYSKDSDFHYFEMEYDYLSGSRNLTPITSHIYIGRNFCTVSNMWTYIKKLHGLQNNILSRRFFCSCGYMKEKLGLYKQIRLHLKRIRFVNIGIIVPVLDQRTKFLSIEKEKYL
jgi:hypothetical protein